MHVPTLSPIPLILAEANDNRAGGSGLDTFIFLVAPLLLFLFFIVLPMRRESRMRREMLGQVKKGDRVLVNGFLIGTVVQIGKGDEEVVIKVDDNGATRMRILRGSITRILKSDDAPAKDGA
jgi:preprotein translocase subunit YajC